MRHDFARGEEAGGVQVVRDRLHAGDADGLLHGVAGGRLLRALDLRPLPRAQQRGRGMKRKLDYKQGRVDLSHGAGGRAMGRLIEDVFLAAFDNAWLRAGDDQASFDVAGGRMAMTTDGYVVSPLFFP